jgi:acetate kinase
MDCERILLMMRRWGYRGVSYKYLAEVFGMAEEEMVKCAKKIGVDVGYGVFFH